MSNAVKLTEGQKQLIERMGVLNERAGIQPASARILGLLLVSPVTELTFDEIRETLNLSKSATSNALKMLQTIRKVVYITKPGDRKRYFKSHLGAWREEIKKDFKKFTSISVMLEEVLEQRPGNTTEFNNSLKDIIDFLKFLNEEFPKLYKKWEATKS